MMGAREDILRRVREALSAPTLRPGGGHALAAVESTPLHTPERHAATARSVLPAASSDPHDWPKAFGRALEDLSGRFYHVVDTEEAAGVVARLEHEAGWTRVYVTDAPLAHAVTLDLRSPRTIPGGPHHAMADCDAGVTTCRALVAQTGSILVTAGDGGRAATVLAPHHIVVATMEQLVPDLPAAWALLAAGGRVPTFASLITGPSRTADIERTLVLGAHGPIRLTVILVG